MAYTAPKYRVNYRRHSELKNSPLSDKEEWNTMPSSQICRAAPTSSTRHFFLKKKKPPAQANQLFRGSPAARRPAPPHVIDRFHHQTASTPHTLTRESRATPPPTPMGASPSDSEASKKAAAPPPRPRRCARDALLFAAGVAAAVLALLGPTSPLLMRVGTSAGGLLVASPTPGPTDGPPTFYDDPSLSYAINVGHHHHRLTDWDAKRASWLRSRGLLGSPEKVVMVATTGDHLLLRFLKNKLDYCRLHGIKLLYNTAHLDPAMVAYWAKLPILRAAMLAHPDAEWLWWVDADAVVTDMDFTLPLSTKYAGHNLVLYGWPKEVYERKRWLGLNAGVFLIRNCQWSLDFLDEWARMGPASPDHARWGKAIRHVLSDRESDVACDQSALAYLLITERERWGDKVHLGVDYYFQGYFVEVVGKLRGVAARYTKVERSSPAAKARALRRRHAEREHLRYAAARNAAVRVWSRGRTAAPSSGRGGGRSRNPAYSRELCEGGMRRALAFADDQVLRAYGFRQDAALNGTVLPMPFDYPNAATPARSR
ncbi:hypothetical protein HU200_046933 [Digitaria exilis]|uniref:Glycosyltransferase 6 n=1 Tax=Digitaria exilis TaxID=1010633 RepID=A0A835AXU2_9POAL|nr:hypothetical protein HU200_046933 [Digitaria exilis]